MLIKPLTLLTRKMLASCFQTTLQNFLAILTIDIRVKMYLSRSFPWYFNILLSAATITSTLRLYDVERFWRWWCCDDFEDWNDGDDEDENDDDFNDLFTGKLCTTVCALWEFNEELISMLFLRLNPSFLLVCL